VTFDQRRRRSWRRRIPQTPLEEVLEYSSKRRCVMIAALACRSSGRIALHIVAMIIDGQIRWHCAGIAREISLS
jgi:hypothetical protein